MYNQLYTVCSQLYSELKTKLCSLSCSMLKIQLCIPLGRQRCSKLRTRSWSQDRCLLTNEAIFNMSRLATGNTAFSELSGLMILPSLSL